MDTAPSVRKRAIRVLHDFCVERPDHPLCATICANIIKRINDNEEGIKKLVYEMFETTWFSPTTKNASVLARRVDQMLEVARMLESDMTTDLFERMMKELMKREAEQESKTMKKACMAIVDHIMQNLLKMDVDTEKSKEENQKVAGSFLVLNLFGRCSPDLIAGHVQSLPQFLNQTLRSLSDQKIVCFTASMLATVVPLMKNPPDFFLAQIEESCATLFMKTGVNIQVCDLFAPVVPEIVTSCVVFEK